MQKDEPIENKVQFFKCRKTDIQAQSALSRDLQTANKFHILEGVGWGGGREGGEA